MKNNLSILIIFKWFICNSEIYQSCQSCQEPLQAKVTAPPYIVACYARLIVTESNKLFPHSPEGFRSLAEKNTKTKKQPKLKRPSPASQEGPNKSGDLGKADCIILEEKHKDV